MAHQVQRFVTYNLLWLILDINCVSKLMPMDNKARISLIDAVPISIAWNSSEKCFFLIWKTRCVVNTIGYTFKHLSTSDIFVLDQASTIKFYKVTTIHYN